MKEFVYLLPECFLVLTAVGILLSEVTRAPGRTSLLMWVAQLGLGGAWLQSVLLYRYGGARLFGGAIAIDGLALFAKQGLILTSAVALAICHFSNEIPARRRPEFFSLVIAATAALSLAVSATDVILIALSLQAALWVFAVLGAFGKRSVLSTEAATKALIFGSLGGALLLFGLAIVFARTEALQLSEIHTALLRGAGSAPSGAFGLGAFGQDAVLFLLVVLALSVPLFLFPLNLWAPDALQGSPIPSAAFLGAVVPMAGVAVALRLWTSLFAQPSLADPWAWQPIFGERTQNMLELLCCVTLLWGGLLALVQSSVRRLLAFLAIAQSGCWVLGLGILDKPSVSAMLLGFVFQALAWLGAHAAISAIGDRAGSDRLSDLRGEIFRALPEALGLIVFVLALVAAPPFAGFVGRFALVETAVSQGRALIGIVVIVGQAICLLGAARLAFALFGDPSTPARGPQSIEELGRRVLIVSLALPVGLGALFADPLLLWVERSLDLILW